MNRLSFNFRLNDGKLLSLSLESEYGGVVTNKYMPEILSPFYGNPFADGTGKNIQDTAEFKADCESIIECLNNPSYGLDYRKYEDWFQVLAAMVTFHIKNYGRLFFSDLKTYVDDVTLLMSAAGYYDGDLKKYYPKFVLWITDEYSQYVKDGNPSVGIIAVTSTPVYRILKEHCSRF